jgi:hypothetical protein
MEAIAAVIDTVRASVAGIKACIAHHEHEYQQLNNYQLFLLADHHWHAMKWLKQALAAHEGKLYVLAEYCVGQYLNEVVAEPTKLGVSARSATEYHRKALLSEADVTRLRYV